MEITVVTPTIPPRFALLLEAASSVAHQTLPAAAHAIAVDIRGEGGGKTRNRAFRQADTDWVAWLDDDDLLMPHHLETLARAQEESGADIVYSYFETIGGSDPVGRLGEPFDPNALQRANFIPVTYLVRAELVRTVGGFESGEGLVDWTFLKAAQSLGAVFHHVPEKTWYWRLNQGLMGRVWTEDEDLVNRVPPMPVARRERKTPKPTFLPGLGVPRNAQSG